MLSTFWKDIVYAARAIVARPTFTTAVVLTLAIGIGASVAIFSLAEQILLRPLSATEPNQLVNLSDPGPRTVGLLEGGGARVAATANGGPDSVFSYPMFRDLERAQEPFVGLAAYYPVTTFLSIGNEMPRNAPGVLVSGSYFPVLGLQPALGRLLGPQDDRVDGEAEAVVLSHAYWQSEFDGDPDVLGRTLFVNDVPLTIVGVAPRGFHGTTVGRAYRASVFVPITITFSREGTSAAANAREPPNHEYRYIYWLHLFARLKPDVTREGAQAAINQLYRAILSEVEAPLLLDVNEQEREAFRTRSLVLEPGARGQAHDQLLFLMRTALLLLLAVSSAVLFLCCANVAALVLLRSSARTGEMAVRASMGASRGRLASMLLAESLVLALPAALISLLVAWLITRGLSRVPGLPASTSLSILEAVSDVRVNTAAVLVAIGVAVASVLAAGFLPARALIRTEPGKTLQAAGARLTTAKGVARFRAALVTMQLALSMALLATMGVFAQTLANIARVDLGVDLDSVVMVEVRTSVWSARRMDEPARTRIMEALDAISGVSSVASSQSPLLSPYGLGFRQMVTVDGVEAAPQQLYFLQVSPSFFQIFGIELLAGRVFNETEIDAINDVIVVDQRFAERFDVAPNAIIGRTIDWAFGPTEIIGVVANVMYGGPASEVGLYSYRPGGTSNRSIFYVKSARPSRGLMNEIRETLSRVIDPGMQFTDPRPMEQQLRDSIAFERFLAGISTVFAVFVTGFAALGLYGVLAYSVAQRSREIGLRIALGAPAGRIGRMVLRQVAGMAVVGVVLGGIAASLLGSAAESFLFGVESSDASALLAAAAVLTAVMVGAAYIPARRASRVDPITALRYE